MGLVVGSDGTIARGSRLLGGERFAGFSLGGGRLLGHFRVRNGISLAVTRLSKGCY